LSEEKEKESHPFIRNPGHPSVMKPIPKKKGDEAFFIFTGMRKKAKKKSPGLSFTPGGKEGGKKKEKNQERKRRKKITRPSFLKGERHAAEEEKEEGRSEIQRRGKKKGGKDEG